VLASRNHRSFTAGGAISAGDPVYDATADVLYVALTDAVLSQVYSVAVDGVWTLPKTNPEVWTKGEALYYDPGTGLLTNIAGGLTRVGTCYADESAGTADVGEIDLGVGV
jgi:predicted RecA/RadA family phage recombinase